MYLNRLIKKQRLLREIVNKPLTQIVQCILTYNMCAKFSSQIPSRKLWIRMLQNIQFTAIHIYLKELNVSHFWSAKYGQEKEAEQLERGGCKFLFLVPSFFSFHLSLYFHWNSRSETFERKNYSNKRYSCWRKRG